MGGSKKQTVGYKYRAYVHFGLGYGPFDKILEGRYADRVFWKCQESGDPNGYGQIVVNKPSLLGGESREGGVSGTIDVGMGYPTQPVNDYLQAKLGVGDTSTLTNSVSIFGIDITELLGGSTEPTSSTTALVPAYRGIVSLIAKNFYWGNNPYLKPVSWLCQRIHVCSDGSEQWYNEKSAIGGVLKGDIAIYIALDTSGSMNVITANGKTRLENAKIAINGFLDFILSKLDQADSIDVCVVGWDGDRVSLTKRSVDTAAINELKAFVDSLETIVLQTVYEQGVLDAAPFFSSTDTCRRYVLFITDGEPAFDGSPGEEITLAEAARATLFATANIQSYAFNIDLADTTYTAYLDNSSGDGVPVISGADPDVFTNILKYPITERADMNPIHFIREIMTDKTWGAALPETEIGSSYITAADTLYDEGLGLSFLFTDDIEYSDMIAEVMRHIDAVRYEDPDTGLQEIKLIRDDIDPESIPLLSPENSEVERLSEPNETDLANQLIIKYHDEENDTDTSLMFHDDAAIEMAGGSITPITVEYSGITNARVANIIGPRDLARFSRPFHKGLVKTSRKFYNLKPGDAFKLTDPEYGISEMICRVVKRSESGQLNGTYKIEFVEDIFSQVHTTYAEQPETGWVDPVGTPQAFSAQSAFEVPYYLHIKRLGDSNITLLSDTACFYGFAGGRPLSGVHLNYDLYVYPDGGVLAPDHELAETADFTPFGITTETVNPGALNIPVVLLSELENIRAGDLIMVGNSADNVREWLALSTAINDGDTSIIVDRGLIDTVPKEIPAGTILYFVGTEYGLYDLEFAPGEIAEGYGIAKNGNGYFAGPYAYHDLSVDGRLFKPYPPANLLLDNQSFPESYSPPTSTVNLSWRHRDRVLQSDQIIDFFEATDYGPEPGTTYLVEADARASDGQLLQQAWFSQNVGLVNSYDFDLVANPPPVGTAEITLRVWSVRGSEISLQAPAASFKTIKAPSAVTAIYKALTTPSGVDISNYF